MPKTTKRCWDCKKIKPLVGFYKNKAQPDGTSSTCKVCSKKYTSNYYKQNKLTVVQKQKDYRKRNERKVISQKLYAKYGITSLQKEQMLQDQNYRCLIGLEKLTYKTAHVDHCHTTGRIRGLLCNKCNVGLGMFGDRPDTLKRAVKYLEGDNEQKRRYQRQKTTG